jgi:hypothetical protein
MHTAKICLFRVPANENDTPLRSPGVFYEGISRSQPGGRVKSLAPSRMYLPTQILRRQQCGSMLLAKAQVCLSALAGIIAGIDPRILNACATLRPIK